MAAGTPIFVACACGGEGSISERLSSGCLMALFVFTRGSHANKTLHVQHKLRDWQPRGAIKTAPRRQVAFGLRRSSSEA